MRIALLTLAASLLALPAQALTVINLDEVTHRVVFESTPGSKAVRTLEPNGSIHTLQHGGVVYLEGDETKIRIDRHDTLVIWKDGNLQIQKRRDTQGDAF